MCLQTATRGVSSTVTTSLLMVLVLLFGSGGRYDAWAADEYTDSDGDGIADYEDCSPSLWTNHIVDPEGLLDELAGTGRVWKTLQEAVNAASSDDVISVYAQTVENVVIGDSTGSGGKNLRIVGCKNLFYAGTLVRAPKITAADPSRPVVHIESTAGASGSTGAGARNIHIENLDVQGATQSSGYLVETRMSLSGTSTLLERVRANGNDVGILIVGDGNAVSRAVNIGANRSFGVRVTGNSNLVADNRVENNSGHGIGVDSDGSVVSKNKVALNSLDGIYVTGHFNSLNENDTIDNGRHGINADSANAVGHNDLRGNEAVENAGQGIRACGQNDLGDNQGSDNGVYPQVDFTCSAISAAKFFVPDKNSNVYKYDAAGLPVSRFGLSGGNDDPSGAAVAGHTVYVLDKQDKRVYRYTDVGGAPQVSKLLKQATGGDLSKPTGLALDGDQLWLVDNSKKMILRYSLASAFSGTGNLNALQQIAFRAGNGSAQGLAIDSTFLYVLDDNNKQFYRYPRAGGSGTASKILRTVNGKNLGAPAGAMFDGTSLWVVDQAGAKVLQYASGSLFSGTGSLNAASQFALAPENAVPQGL